jgi:DNA-binding NtrC family response regulator
MPRATILFVDDDEKILSALRRALRHTDYRLLFATRPDEALDLLEREKADIVVSDHLMPGMTGFDLLKVVRQRHPEVVRIMLTGQATAEVAVTAVKQGEIYRCLSKPWEDAEMQVTLHLACERLALERENRRLVAVLRAHEVALVRLRIEHPSIAAEIEQIFQSDPCVEDEPLEAVAH